MMNLDSFKVWMYNVTGISVLISLIYIRTISAAGENTQHYLSSNYDSYNGRDTSDVNNYVATRAEKKYEKRKRKLHDRWGFNIDGFLEKYGYLDAQPNTASPERTRVHSNYERKVAVRLYQEFHGIKPTGKLNKKTVKVMKEPRCGLPDMRLDDPYSNIRLFHYYRYYPRWRRQILTWRALKYTKKISPLGLWKTLKKAFETWESVSGLRFLYTRQTPDIQIDFEHGNHGDGRKIAFDEKNGQVAHAFGPGTYTISGAVHFDDDEQWTLSVDPNEGLNLLGVAIHQLGHSLGLQHSKNPRSVMFPTFVKTNLDLSIEDIDKVQILYGPNPNRPTPIILEDKESKPKVCKIPMDDMELGPDGYGYIFRGSNLRQIDPRGKLVKTKEKVRIADIYEKGPTKVDAVAFYKERKKTYMFYTRYLRMSIMVYIVYRSWAIMRDLPRNSVSHVIWPSPHSIHFFHGAIINDNTLWRYTNFHLDLGYPKNISGMPERPRAGAFIRDQYGITRLLLFGVEDFWEWSTARDYVRKGYPLSTLQYFQGLPRNITAAVRWKDGYIYFFKNHKVYKVNPGSYNVIAGYPKPLPTTWMKGFCNR